MVYPSADITSLVARKRHADCWLTLKAASTSRTSAYTTCGRSSATSTRRSSFSTTPSATTSASARTMPPTSRLPTPRRLPTPTTSSWRQRTASNQHRRPWRTALRRAATACEHRTRHLSAFIDRNN